jgi:hypothetical protein
MTSWRPRLIAAATLWMAIQVHGHSTSSLPNTPLGMLVFHGSAAAVDMLLLCCAPRLLAGRLCREFETLCIVSMIVNFSGWLAYLAYAPPIFYNAAAWGLSYVQWARLFIVDRHDADHLGFNLVFGAHRVGDQFNLGKAHT